MILSTLITNYEGINHFLSGIESSKRGGGGGEGLGTDLKKKKYPFVSGLE